MPETKESKKLQRYIEKGCNILTPSISIEGLMNLADRHKASLETSYIMADPDWGDTWTTDSKRYIVSKQAIDRLSIMANVLWHERGGVERIDPKDNRDYIEFRAFAAIRKPDGSLAPVQATYSIDLVAEQEDLEYRYREKGAKPGKWQKKGEALDDYVEHCVGRDMRFKRKHLVPICESGARNRVNRWLLGFRKSYSEAELKRPFVVVTIRYQPDYNDPETRRIADMIAMGAQAQIFGTPGRQQEALPAPNGDDVVTVDPEDPTQPKETTDDNAPPPNGEPPLNGNDLSLDDMGSEFGLWDRESQLKHIHIISKRKNYDFNDLIERMPRIHNQDDLSESQIQAIYEHICTLADVFKKDRTPFDDDDDDVSDIPF